MLTAMDLGHLPPALIRSGRVELWLEMKMPDQAARRKILEERFARSVPEKVTVDLPQLLDATEGFTGADLRRLVEDGKNLWAYTLSKGIANPQEHFLEAAREITRNKKLLAEAETRASAHFSAKRSGRAVWGSYVESMVRRAQSEE
jgi:ATP-dependent 26S proteasome regulatory subunit